MQPVYYSGTERPGSREQNLKVLKSYGKFLSTTLILNPSYLSGLTQIPSSRKSIQCRMLSLASPDMGSQLNHFLSVPLTPGVSVCGGITERCLGPCIGKVGSTEKGSMH